MSQNSQNAAAPSLEEIFAQLREKRIEYSKTPVQGERFSVPRKGTDSVDTIVYRPKNVAQEKLPVLFNLHGGAWVAGDAVLMESFCTLLAEEIPAVVVNVNYKKLDVHPFPYPQVELCDVVLYFAEHADELGVDNCKFAIGGHSAGAHISAGVAMRLKEMGFELACQMLVYPFTDFTAKSENEEEGWNENLIPLFIPDGNLSQRWISPLQAKDEELAGIAPAIFVICGKDELKPMGVAYAKRLIDVAVPVKFKEYPDALHGFLEINREEYEGDERQSPEQLVMTRDCEQFLIRELRAYFEGVGK